MKKIFLLFILLFQALAKEELKTYSELNCMETIDASKKFIIETSEASMAYFDSYDKNSVIYISNNLDSFNNEKDERINGKFYRIEPNTKYYIRNSLYFKDQPSVFKKYVFPLNLEGKALDISGNKINFLYLEKDKTYTLDFQNNSIQKIIKLSRKTLDSKVVVKTEKEETELNQDLLYYKINEEFTGSLTLEIKENDAFLEFLSSVKNDEDIEIKKNEGNNKIKKNKINIVFDYTQEDFFISLFSDKPFKYSFSYGFSKDENYFYDSDSNVKIDAKKYKEGYITEIALYSIYKNISLFNKEFFSFFVKVTKSEPNQEIEIMNSYRYTDNGIIKEIMNAPMNNVYRDSIIKNLKELINYYVYTDIAQIPPEIDGHPNYHHEKINLKEELENIGNTNYNKYYEFYQDVQKVLTATKDLHFSVTAKNFNNSNNKNMIGNFIAVLPFNFKIKLYDGDYCLFIESNDFINIYNSDIKNFIYSHENIPLKSINDVDPFDYIQNWSKFKQLKNKHAEFTYIIGEISKFNLNEFPLNYSDLSLNDYEFEDNKLLRIGYKLLDKRDTSIDIKDNKKTIRSNIKWDNSRDEKIKCRKDDKNRVNVIVQNSFNIERKDIYYFLNECINIFNYNYPIIIIESKNRGGYGDSATIMNQFLQPRIAIQEYDAYKLPNLFQELYRFWGHGEFDDKYGEIKHKRTEAFPLLSVQPMKALVEQRKYFINSFNTKIKNPTDIIVFTDAFSFSATSILIKGFQKTGGAIIVGYFGNPKIKGTEEFDGSQSDSAVLNKNEEEGDNIQSYDFIQRFQKMKKFTELDIYKNLEEKGFIINSITTGESYEFYQKNTKGQIPQEYTFKEVDDRVDIYSEYSDDIYNDFIEEGKKIHERFKTYCNSRNQRLLLYNSNCVNGGYQCGDENRWSKTCKQNYCSNVEQYFDHNLGKCVDIKYDYSDWDSTKAKFILSKDINEEITLEKGKQYYFIFGYSGNLKYGYQLSNGKMGWINHDSNILYIDTSTQGLLKSDNEELKLKIESHETPVNILNSTNNNLKYSIINLDIKETMIVFENSEEENVLYIDNIYKNPNTKVKIAEYNDQMTLNDTLNPNSKYFKENNKNIILLEKNKIYLLYFKLNALDPFNIFINPVSDTNDIFISNNKSILYLKKGKEYNLIFQNNTLYRLMKLSRETPNAKINISITNENINLNKYNLYYELEDIYTGNLSVSVSNEDAMIEFLFKQDDIDCSVLDFEDREFILSTKYNLLPIPEKYKDKKIKIELIGMKEESKISIYLGYSLLDYSLFSLEDNYYNKISFYGSYNLTLTEHYKGDIKLMKDEYYFMMLEIFDDFMEMQITFEEEKKEEEENEGLKWWEKLLIGIFSSIGGILLILFIYILIRKSQTPN